MKNRKWMTLGAALAFLFTAQPVYAAPVIVAGSGNRTEAGQVPGSAAQETVSQTPGADNTLTQAPGESLVADNTASQAPAAGSENQASEAETLTQSPTIVSGQEQSTASSPTVVSGAAAGTESGAAVTPSAAGTVTDVAEGLGGIKSDPVTPVVPEEQASQVALQTGTVDPSKPMVALTFDDGPQPSVGNRIMDCLAQYGGKATFFMVGARVGFYKTEVQRMVAEGHEVANHTMNHKYLQKLGAAQIQAQVNQGNDAIQAACGVRPTLLRLPGGNHNATVVANAGMPMIQWNVDTLDWKTRNADKTVAAVLNHVKDGDIILMHELYGATGDAVARIVPELHKRGFQMVTVSQMAAAKGRSLEAGKLYSSFH